MAANLPGPLDIPASQPFGKPVLDSAFTYIVNRFLILESFKPSYQAAIDQLNAIGLDRINAAIQPIYQRLAGFAQIGAIFSTSSTTSVSVATGTATFVVAAADASAFAAAAYIGVQHRGDTKSYMSGKLVSYDRSSGTLVLLVDNTGGTGTFADWIISASVEPPSNLDVGAALTAQLTAFEGVVNGEINQLQQNVNGQLSSFAPLQSPSLTGTPTTVDPATNDISAMIPTTRWVQNLIGKVNAAIAGVTSAVGLPIRADAGQSLTAQQQLQARTNAGAAARGANSDITALSALTTMICSGAATISGLLTVNGGLIAQGIGNACGQIVAYTSNFSMGLYADGGTQAYLMSTAAGNPGGRWSGLRPLSWNISTGAVTIAADGASTTTGGSVTINGGLQVNGGINFPNARPTWAGLTPFDNGNLTRAAIAGQLGYYPACNDWDGNQNIGLLYNGNAYVTLNHGAGLGYMYDNHNFNPATKMNIDGGATVVGYNSGNTGRPYISGSAYRDLMWSNDGNVCGGGPQQRPHSRTSVPMAAHPIQ